ncbi:MAG: DUF4362 domain-containing protein [Erysipelotrichales bacterium]|nr:MAG: DUF4362 domain-containing protein [Erysipelotrichales bacterium]
MRKTFTTVLILLLFLSACSTKQPMSDAERFIQMRSTLSKIPLVYPMQDAIADKHFVNTSIPPFTYNSSTLRSFTDKIANGITAELIVASYPDEGNVILTLVQYSGKSFLALRDTTRDMFGVKIIEEFNYKKWLMFEYGGKKGYYLFNRDVSKEEFMKSLFSSHSEHQIDNLYVCSE